jgi:predicted transporter
VDRPATIALAAVAAIGAILLAMGGIVLAQAGSMGVLFPGNWPSSWDWGLPMGPPNALMGSALALVGMAFIAASVVIWLVFVWARSPSDPLPLDP